MKVMIIFSSKNPRKEEMKKYQMLVEEFATNINIPVETEFDWYVVNESVYEQIKNKVESVFSENDL